MHQAAHDMTGTFGRRTLALEPQVAQYSSCLASTRMASIALRSTSPLPE